MFTFVGDLDEKTESFCGLELESFGDVLAEIFRACARLHLKVVVRVVREVDLVLDVRHSFSNGVNLHLVRRILSRSVSASRKKRT